VNKGLEEARARKAVGASLEAKLVLHASDPVLSAALAKYASRSDLRDQTSEMISPRSRLP
jgi:isoleucyl-tRNA synthetase